MTDDRRITGAVLDLARDIVAFSHYGVQSHPLRSYQAPVARAVAESVTQGLGLELAAVFSRQSGKDEMLAQLCAWLLWLRQYDGGTIVVAHPALRPQGIISRDRVIARLSGPLTAGRARIRDGAVVQLGQAQARFLSASPAANSRGNTASLLLVANEAQDIDVDTWDAVFAPMGAASNVTTLYMGTVWTSTTLLARQLRLLAGLERRDGVPRRFIVPWRVVAAELPAYGRYVRRQMDLLGEHHPFIRTEYELEELDGGGSLFPPERREPLRGEFRPLVRPAPDDPPGTHYAFTIDVAGEEEDGTEGAALRQARPRRDSTALSVVRVRPGASGGLPAYEVVARYEWTGTRHTDLHDRIVSLATRVWNARVIVIDSTGIGAGLASFLTATLGERVVVPFLFTSASKSALAWDLLGLIDSGRLRVYTPAAGDDAEQVRLDALFWKQLAACRYTVLPGPNRLIRWSVEDDTLHDDVLMSTALIAVLDRQDWRPRRARGIPPPT